jgi:hypothetical protein
MGLYQKNTMLVFFDCFGGMCLSTDRRSGNHSRHMSPLHTGILRLVCRQYTLRGSQKNKMPALEFALKNKRSAFASNLVLQLEDGMAQAQHEEEPFLGFDPVLNSQDPAPSYVVESVATEGNSCLAKILVSQGKKSESPDVIAELVLKDERWLFMNFHYPNSEDSGSKDLLSMLAFLQKPKKNDSH